MVMAMSVMFSSMLSEPFAGAEIEDCGGEEDDGCDGENCVVHEDEDRARVLRKWSAVDKDFVREREGRKRPKNHHGGSIEERFLSARADAFTGSEREEKASARSARNDRLGWVGHPLPGCFWVRM
jgi:hypothetical protein